MKNQREAGRSLYGRAKEKDTVSNRRIENLATETARGEREVGWVTRHVGVGDRDLIAIVCIRSLLPRDGRGGRPTSAVFHLESINIPAWERRGGGDEEEKPRDFMPGHAAPYA